MDNPVIVRVGSFRSAKAQIRSLLTVLGLIASDYDGRDYEWGCNNNFIDWSATVVKGRWKLQYEQCTSGPDEWFKLELTLGAEDKDEESYSLRIICHDYERQDEKCWRAEREIDALHLKQGAWPDIDADDPLKLLPIAERFNPCSPYMMGSISRCLNWFAQLPEPMRFPTFESP